VLCSFLVIGFDLVDSLEFNAPLSLLGWTCLGDLPTTATVLGLLFATRFIAKRGGLGVPQASDGAHMQVAKVDIDGLDGWRRLSFLIRGDAFLRGDLLEHCEDVLISALLKDLREVIESASTRIQRASPTLKLAYDSVEDASELIETMVGTDLPAVEDLGHVAEDCLCVAYD